MIGWRKRLCPFVDQNELLDRMRRDVARIRCGLPTKSCEEELAVQLVDRWISQTIAEVSSRHVAADELQLIVQEWQLRRARYFPPAAADVIVIDG
jgi:hypothetical protein